MEMRDVNTTMFRIKEFLSTNTITIEDVDKAITLRVIKRLLSIFSMVRDVRQKKKVTYRLDCLLLMEFLAAVGGADNGPEAQIFWLRHKKLYKKLFGYENVPSHDTFDRVLGLIRSSDMNELMVEIILKADDALRKVLKLPKVSKRHLSVDGKQLRGTGRVNTENGAIRDLQTLNIYDNTADTCLYTERIEDKTNEIPHAQAILGAMELRNVLVTFDAMHTQKETVRIISKQHGDYIGGLKGNQHSFCYYVEDLFTEKKLQEILSGAENYTCFKEIAHNQLEEREFYLIAPSAKQRKNEFKEWEKLRSVIYYKKTCTNNITGKKTTETRYYISSLTDVAEIAIGIREHWGVENRLHHGLDTLMMEDQMGIANKNTALNRSIMNKMCLALFRKIQELQNLKGKVSKKILRKSMGWDYEMQMKEALALLDPIALKKCLVITPKK